MDTKIGNISILVVDDEPISRGRLQEMLVRKGYLVDLAVDGSEAFEKIKDSRCDIVISDIEMPHMNGYELLQEIKKSFPEVQVIIMTAPADSNEIKDCLLLGADEFISKPFRSTEVDLVVERACRRVLLAQPESISP